MKRLRGNAGAVPVAARRRDKAPILYEATRISDSMRAREAPRGLKSRTNDSTGAQLREIILMRLLSRTDRAPAPPMPPRRGCWLAIFFRAAPAARGPMRLLRVVMKFTMLSVASLRGGHPRYRGRS